MKSAYYFHTGVRQDTVALVARDVVNARPLVEAGVGGTFVDVGLAVGSLGVRTDTRLSLRSTVKRRGKKQRIHTHTH